MTSDANAAAAPLRFGIIGMGKMGRIRADTVDERPDTELVAICDADPARTEDRPGIPAYDDYRDLLERDDLDAVFVCTFNNASPDITIAALEGGFHVFCEKPPGRSVADVERIREAEAATDPFRRLKFGFNHRFHYAILEARSLVESGRYGRLLWLRGTYGKAGGIQFENAWRNKRDIAGGGILLDQGIHMLDLMLHFAGDFTDVQSAVETMHWNIPLEDNAFAILRNDAGQVGLLHSSATQWKHKFALELGLEEGYVNINGILSSTRSYGEESITFARRQFEDETFAFGKPREETVFFDRDDSWRLELDDFVRAVREDRPATAGTSAESLRVMQLIEEIYRVGRRR